MAIDEKLKPLLTQIFKSELDYYTRSVYKTVLSEEAVLSDVDSAIFSKADRAIPKDEATISSWVDKLTQTGMDFVAEDKELNELRIKVLNEEEDRLRVNLSEVNSHLSNLNSLFVVQDEHAEYRESIGLSLKEDKEIRKSSYDGQVAHWNLRKQEIEEKISLLVDLQASDCVFTLGGQ